MRKEILIVLFLLLFGCLEQQYEVGCCSQINDNDPEDDIPGFCEYIWNGSHQIPIVSYFSDMVGEDVSITKNSCDVSCDISFSFQKGGENKEKNFIVPFCQAYDEINCLPRSCAAMVCGDFRFKAKAYGTPSDYIDKEDLTTLYGGELGLDKDDKEDKDDGEDKEDLEVINLLNARCSFTLIDNRLERHMSRAGGFINSFRVGAGSSFDQFEIARYYIPTSDYACSLNPSGYIDRFMNYLGYLSYKEPPGSNPDEEFKDFFYDVTTCIFSSEKEFAEVFEGMQYPPAFDKDLTFKEESGMYAMVDDISSVPYNKSWELINRSFYRIWLRKTNEITPGGSTYPFECMSGSECLSASCSKNDYNRGVCKNEETNENPTCDCRTYPFDDYAGFYGEGRPSDYYYLVCSAYTDQTDPIYVDFLYRGSTAGDECNPTYEGTIAPRIFFSYIPCNGAPASLDAQCTNGIMGIGYATMNEEAFKETTFYKACEPNYIVLSEFIDVNGFAPYDFSEVCPPKFADTSPKEDPLHPNTEYDEDTALFNFSVRLAVCLPEHPYVHDEDQGLEQYPEYPGYDACNPSSLNWPFCLPVSGIHWEGTDQEEDKHHGCFYFYRDLILIKDTGKCFGNEKGLIVSEYGWCEPCTLLTTAMEYLKIDQPNPDSVYHFAPNASYMYSKNTQYLATGVMPIIDASDEKLWKDEKVVKKFTYTTPDDCEYVEQHPENYGFMDANCFIGSSFAAFMPPFDEGEPGGGGGGQYCTCTGFRPMFLKKTINESGPVIVIVANLTYFDISNQEFMEEATKRGLVTRYLCKSCIPALRVKADTTEQKNEILKAFFGLPEEDESCFTFVSRIMGSECNQRRLSSFDLIVTEFQPGKLKRELEPGLGQEETNKLILENMTNFTHTTLIRYSKLTFVDDISACLGPGECWPEEDWRGLQSFYTYLLQNQENLVARGFIGIHFQNWSGNSKNHYMAAKTIGDDGLEYDEMKSKLYCSFASPTYFLIHGPPTTFYNKVFASKEVTCVKATPADYLKYCGSAGGEGCSLIECDDGSLCTCPEGNDCSSGWKCPEGQVAESCPDCSSIGSKTCTLTYQNGQTEQKTFSPDQLQYYPEIIASLPRGSKCCVTYEEIDEQTGEVLSTLKYTFYKSLYQRTGAVPIVYSLRGMIDEQCLMSSFIEENEDFCGASLPNVPYKIENCK